MKQTQYAKILQALRRAGNKGCTVRDLLQFTNYPSARIHEMTHQLGDYVRLSFGGRRISGGFGERIERHERQHNGRAIRVYVLKRVK